MQARLGGNYVAMDFGKFWDHFTKDVPEGDRLSDKECRLSWARELATAGPDYVFTKKTKDMRTGKMLERDYLWVEAGTGCTSSLHDSIHEGW